MSEQTDKELGERIKTIFPDVAVASRMVDIVVSKRPMGVSRKCHYPYYKESYALRIRDSVDQQIKTREDIIFRYDTFAELSKRTLYNLINQSIRYLCDCLDPDKKYDTWRKVVDIHHDKRRGGVVLSLMIGFRAGDDGKSFGGELVAPRDDKTTPQWQIDMDEWLESGNTKPFLRERLALTVEQVAEVKVELENMKKQGMPIIYSVDCRQIKIMRLNLQ